MFQREEQVVSTKRRDKHQRSMMTKTSGPSTYDPSVYNVGSAEVTSEIGAGNKKPNRVQETVILCCNRHVQRFVACVWIFGILVSFGFAFCTCILRFMEEPTSISFLPEEPDELPIPGFTVCMIPSLPEELLETGLLNNADPFLSDEPRQDILHRLATKGSMVIRIPETHPMVTSHDIQHEYHISLPPSADQIDIPDIGYVTSDLTFNPEASDIPQSTNCHMFKPIQLTADPASVYAYSVILTMELAVGTTLDEISWLFKLHPLNEPPAVYHTAWLTNGLILRPSREYTVNVLAEKFVTLNLRKRTCHDEHNYAKTQCIEDCRIAVFDAEAPENACAAGWTGLDHRPLCDSHSSHRDFLGQVREIWARKTLKCNCNKCCHEIHYHGQATEAGSGKIESAGSENHDHQRRKKRNASNPTASENLTTYHTTIFIAYDSPRIDVYTEYLIYDGRQCLAEIGGYIGLILGFSLFDLGRAASAYINHWRHAYGVD